MALDNSDKKILQDIVDLNGKCLESSRCRKCPFRSNCLPEFLNPNPPTQTQRFNMALAVLTNDILMGDDDATKGIKVKEN